MGYIGDSFRQGIASKTAAQGKAGVTLNPNLIVPQHPWVPGDWMKFLEKLGNAGEQQFTKLDSLSMHIFANESPSRHLVEVKILQGREAQCIPLRMVVLRYGQRVCIPCNVLKHLFLEELHAGHLGIVKNEGYSWGSFVYWKNIDNDIEEAAKNCADCARYKADPPKSKVHYWEHPRSMPPWGNVYSCRFLLDQFLNTSLFLWIVSTPFIPNACRNGVKIFLRIGTSELGSSSVQGVPPSTDVTVPDLSQSSQLKRLTSEHRGVHQFQTGHFLAFRENQAASERLVL
ncbi:transposon Tf2-9 polyprotein [Trichonephila clavipes]|nr:transposon Tf2-9 polyprotein [Trichonephila clavipes]